MSFTVLEVLNGAMGDNQEPDFEWAARSDWVRWMNEAIAEISELASPLRGQHDITLVENQSDYDLPSDVIRVKRVTWGNNGTNDDGDKIFPRSETEDDRWGHTENLTYTTIHGTSDFRVMKFNPTPDGSEDGETVNVYYVKLHDEVSDDGDVINFPRSIKYNIVDFMNYKFTQQDDELQKMQFNRSEWQRSVRASMRRMNNKAEVSKLVDGQAQQRRNYRKNY